MSRMYLNYVYSKKNNGPVAINFQNAYTSNFKEKPCLLLENSKEPSRTVAIEMDGLLYTGASQNNNDENTFLLARNKSTGKVRLIEIDNISMKPMSTVNYEESNLLETDKTDLKKKFGTKKQKRDVEQREKLKVNAEIMQEQIKTATQNITEDQIDLSCYNRHDGNDFYIPPMDRTATKVEDVYPIYKMLTEEQYETIYSEIKDTDYRKELHPLLQTIVSNRVLSPIKAVLALYASCLLKLTTLLVKEIQRKTFQSCPYSATLNKIILDNFTVLINGKARNRPTPYKDKSLCHSIVFILLINDFRFEVDDFCKAMKLTANTTALKVRSIGASIMTLNGKKYVQLKLPLNKGIPLKRKSAKF